MKTYANMSEKLVLHEVHAIYVTIPKTGCTSVKKFFSNHYGWKEVENVHNPESEIYSHIVNEDITSEKYNGYFKFAFVRNPFSRLYSAYKSKIKPGIVHPKYIDGVEMGLYKMGLRKEHTFLQFVDLICSIPDELCDPHVKSQWQFIYNDDGRCIVNELYRFENFSTELLRVAMKLGILLNSDKIPHENKAQANHAEYKGLYNDYTIDAVAKRYDKDFELFEYSRNFTEIEQS